MATPRPNKGRKPFNDNASPVQGSRGGRGSAWRNSGGPSFGNSTRQNNQFPPLAGSAQRPETGYDPKLLSTLATVMNQIVIITLKSGARHEGTVVGTISEGDAAGVTLKDSRDVSNPASTVRESFVIPASNILSWSPRATNGTDGFRTDTDISNTNGATASRERELQQWQPDAAPAATTAAASLAALGDEATFGPAGYSGIPWDQFEANEQLFGVTAKFDEEAYTTKIDRNAPGFKERERKAQQLANEIMSGTTSNPHVAEERAMNGTENGIGEEEKYSAVVRAPGAYVPPGARRNGSGPTPNQANPPPAASPSPGPAPAQAAAAAAPSPATTTNGTAPPVPTITTPSADDSAPKPPAEGLVANFRDFVTNEKQRLAQRKQAMVKTEMDKRKADLLKFSKNFKLSRPIPEDLVPILAKDEEKQKAIREKAIADVLATQTRSAASNSGTSGPSSVTKAPNSSDSTAKPAAKPAASPDGTKKAKTSMFIQAIPPFNKDKTTRKPAQPTTGATTSAAPAADGAAAPAQPTPGPSNASASATPASPTTAQAVSRLNANASVFRPNANAPPFKPISPGATPAPKAKEPLKESTTSNIVSPPNPFYGNRVPTKKGVSVHLKEDFNPFRHSKVADASQVSSIWPYNGKRYAALHPMPPVMHTAPGPTVPNPVIPGPPPQQHEEDPNASQGPGQRPIPPQQQQQQQPPQPQPPQPQPPYPTMMYYPQYPYSPAPHGQPPVMMPPASPFMPGHYMQPVPYPPHMQPNGMDVYSWRSPADQRTAPPMYGHPPPGMQGMPPTPHYMPHPPYGQTSPPPTGTPRGPGPMPPQQMPPHAYYHPSPQLTHAMPYPMMMPPQPGAHFDPAQGGPPPVAPQPAPMGH